MDIREHLDVIQQQLTDLKNHLSGLNDEAPAAPKPKTIREWLETLPDGYMERALKNMDRENVFVKDLAAAIHAAFTWVDSPEQDVFWLDMEKWAQGKGPLPALPDEIAENGRNVGQSEKKLRPWRIDEVPAPLMVRKKTWRSERWTYAFTADAMGGVNVLLASTVEPVSLRDLSEKWVQRNGQPCGVFVWRYKM